MDQVITFDKSLQERLQEYHDVLSGYEILSVSSIAKEWSFYLELTLDPNGWQAIWKIPRSTCEYLKISFPSIVLVFVLHVEFKNLQALVKILAVQDDIHLPEKHYVPLTQLWPTKDQDESIPLNLRSTANALDMLRFFYLHVFMPWDHEDEDMSDWKGKHLESRLRLYYDMKNGIIPRATGEHLHGLLTEARRLQSKREQIESQLEESDGELDGTTEINNKNVENLMQIHVRMLEIKGEVEILENPLLRNVVIQRQLKVLPKHDSGKNLVWLIYEEGKADDYIEFLQKVKVHFPDNIVTFHSDLGSTLEVANSNDIFVLNESSHTLRTTGALETGGTLRGIGGRNKILLSSNNDDVMLDLMGDHILLENITIDASIAQCALLVRRGNVVLSNCKIIGDGISSTHQGIIVLAGGSVEIINCEITKFSTAIVGNSGSQIKLENSEIHDVKFGLKVYDNCAVSVQKCTFHDCKDYGICIETDNNLVGDNRKVGDFESLNIVPNVKSELISGTNNIKGDVIINKKSQINPIKDLFKNSEVDLTACGDSGSEDMETTGNMDNTVIENDRMSPATI